LTDETPIIFSCNGGDLVGVVHGTGNGASRGVLIVVGGPQYRVGSHRQFLLLARSLAAAGIPAMRFDYRGIGDSDGPLQGFEDIGDDISAAIDAFLDSVPGLETVVLWGLCDAASAILFYGHTDSRINGTVLLNPWVRTESGVARAYVKYYYRERLFDPVFWRKVASGQFNPIVGGRTLLGILRKAVRGGEKEPGGDVGTPETRPLPERMADGLQRFQGRVLLVISGDDLTAQEFEDAVATSGQWQGLVADERVTRRYLADGDHTFSRRAWRDQVASWTIEWLESW
jgi:exosortase A-associated hydrolase 1